MGREPHGLFSVSCGLGIWTCATVSRRRRSRNYVYVYVDEWMDSWMDREWMNRAADDWVPPPPLGLFL